MTPVTATKAATELPGNLEMFLDVPVAISVQLGSCRISMRDVLQLNAGSLVQLDKLADSPVDVLVNDKLVARGEVVVVENRFGIKITEMVGS
ncbi:MAG TPA: flagellar motor switch protein FliN [Verrucomicrobiae bacterium]|nr:flagellar motor switch protein FliN [Verrucomicrobiae bacterium]